MLAWDASTNPDTTGYVVYWGTNSGAYTHCTNVGNVLHATIGGLDPKVNHYFAATAHNKSGLESDLSNEVCAVAPARTLVLTVERAASAAGPFEPGERLTNMVFGTSRFWRLKIEPGETL